MDWRTKKCTKCRKLYNSETGECPNCLYLKGKEKNILVMRELQKNQGRAASKRGQREKKEVNVKIIEQNPTLEEYVKTIPKRLLKKSTKINVEKISVVITLRGKYKLSYPKIAKILGYKDHSTVLHLWKKYG